MNYERMMFSGDLSAPVWRELPKPINGSAKPKKAEGVSTDSAVVGIASEGDSLCSPAEVLPSPLPPIPAVVPTPAELSTHWGEWIPHDGGPCPVDRSATVRLRFRGGSEAKSLYTAGDHYWKHDGDSCDIVAYKVIA